jgi:hypothetical protein
MSEESIEQLIAQARRSAIGPPGLFDNTNQHVAVLEVDIGLMFD